MKHLLTHEELLQIKALKERRRVSTTDAPMLNAIYGRMTPGYEICTTCIEALAAEAKSLIAYAEKQIDGKVIDYTGSEEDNAQIEDSEKIADQVVEPDRVTATKEVTVFRENYKGRPAFLTLLVPSEIDGVPVPDDHSIEGNFKVLSVNYDVAGKQDKNVQINDAILKTKGLTEAIQGDQVKEVKETNVGLKFTAVQIKELPTPELIAYVEKETDIELSEHADREELVADALELLGLVDAPGAAKFVLHKNGLTAMKGDAIYGYVKQETGTELPKGLKRPALLIAAAEALKDGK